MTRKQPAAVRAAREELRAIQRQYGRSIQPVLSAEINMAWERALEQDPNGSQLKYVIQEARERLAPMAQ